MSLLVTLKKLLIINIVLFATISNVFADYRKDIQDMFDSWVAGDARYFVSLQGRHFLLGSRSAWGKGNDKVVDILLENGYLDTYKNVRKDCTGTNAFHPDCKSNNETILFRPTDKMEGLFKRESMDAILAGTATGLYFPIGKVSQFNVIEIKISNEPDCDYEALVRKRVSEKTEVGNLITRGDDYKEWYCFTTIDNGISLVGYYPEY